MYIRILHIIVCNISSDIRHHIFMCNIGSDIITFPGGGGGIPYIKVYGDGPQVWVLFSHLLVFIWVINSRF